MRALCRCGEEQSFARTCRRRGRSCRHGSIAGPGAARNELKPPPGVARTGPWFAKISSSTRRVVGKDVDETASRWAALWENPRPCGARKPSSGPPGIIDSTSLLDLPYLLVCKKNSVHRAPRSAILRPLKGCKVVGFATRADQSRPRRLPIRSAIREQSVVRRTAPRPLATTTEPSSSAGQKRIPPVLKERT